MTLLGKIFAVVNLVLSLAVAAFIVMSFAARTRWHDAYEQINKQLTVAVANANTAQKDAEAARADVEKCKKDADAAKAQAQTVENGLRAENEREKSAHDAEMKRAQALLNARGGDQTELQSRQREVDYLKTLVFSRDEKLKQMEQQLEAEHNKATDNEIARMSTQRRLDEMLVEQERMSKELKKAQQAGPTAVAANGKPRKNPPPDDVEGLVKAIDPESGYVTLSIGSDAGLTKGNTLEAYRLKPEPAYLGTVEILAVQPDQAVAKPVARVRGTIQVGDRVSSTIVNHR
jgi:hypothetical protein